MRFATPLIPARLIGRYKRFLADMTLENGETVTVHCPNPGSMLGLAAPGSPCWLSHHPEGKRKLTFGWEIVAAQTDSGKAYVGINTGCANRLFEEAFRAGKTHLDRLYGRLRREVVFGPSRLDFGLEDANGRLAALLEVKSVTLSRKTGIAEFPDARTARGARHLATLAAAVNAGYAAYMVFVIQRQDCRTLATAADIDPNYDAALKEARAAGVTILAYACNTAPDGIEISESIPVPGFMPT